MRVAELRIENFRGIRCARLRFGQHTVLIGPNNCGKTTIIEALSLLFGRDRMVRPLTEHDFFGSDPQPAARIRIVATLTDFPTNDPSDRPDWFRDDRSVPKWLDATGSLHASHDRPEWQLACQLAFAARFDQSSLEVETVRYFHDDDAVDDVFIDEVPTHVPPRLVQELGFFLVSANRTWDRVMSFGSELFRRVLASGLGPPATAALQERDRLRHPTTPLEQDPNLAGLVRTLEAELRGFFAAGPELKLRLTSTDSDGLLQAVMPHYKYPADTLPLPARRQGSGLVSLQSLLLLLEFGRRRTQAGQGFWLAVEEPELHVPPALQRRLVARVQDLSTQTFVSTHSPVVASLSDPTALLILRNEAGVLTGTPLQEGPLPRTTPNSIRKLFQINRTETVSALMHDIVLVPEGRTDFDWLRLILRATECHQGWGQSDLSFGTVVGVVPTHDAAVVETFRRLATLHTRVVCLVDGDEPGLDYLEQLWRLAHSPSTILRWPNGWSIEDVVGWLISAEQTSVMEWLQSVDLAPAPSSLDEVVSRLKSVDRVNGGLKQDMVAYDSLAQAIASHPGCLQRARELLGGMYAAFVGTPTSRFLPMSDRPSVFRFQP